jgi:hypothetical protein
MDRTREAQAVGTGAARPWQAPADGEADLIDAMTPGGAVAAEFLAGAVMIGSSLIYLVILGDISLRAFVARVDFTTALVSRLLVVGAILAGTVLLGALLIRRCHEESGADRLGGQSPSAVPGHPGGNH